MNIARYSISYDAPLVWAIHDRESGDLGDPIQGQENEMSNHPNRKKKGLIITAHTTTTLESQAVLPSGTVVVDDWAREDGIDLGGSTIPYTELRGMPDGTYRIVDSKWGAYYSGAGYDGRYISLTVQRVD